jgi:hypothetical protein
MLARLWHACNAAARAKKRKKEAYFLGFLAHVTHVTQRACRMRVHARMPHACHMTLMCDA